LNDFSDEIKIKQALCLHNAWARPFCCKGHNPRELIFLRMRKLTHIIISANSKNTKIIYHQKLENITKSINLDPETIITLIYAFKE
jgi:hypothetical protein